jgi:hypothetical protein
VVWFTLCLALYPEGSESQFGPLNVLVNGGFDILRNASYSPRPFDYDYGTGAVNVLWNLTHPSEVIGGRHSERFVAHEVVPLLGLDPRYGQFAPNWFSHTLGEAMLSRRLGAWFDQRGVPYGRVAGIATVMAMQWLNEVVENDRYRGANADPIADLLLFNPLGMVLFSLDSAWRFFRGPIQLNYWPGQAAMDPRDGALVNHGENYAFKFSLGDWTPARAFFYIGQQGLGGLCWPFGVLGTVSVGAGIRLLELERVAEDGYPVLIPAGGFNTELGLFWDRNESLLASVLLGWPSSPTVTVNVYPNVVGPVGFFVSTSRVDGWVLGLTSAALPLVPGVQIGRDRPPSL